jgi:CheY-like chemotaxis protein
MSDPLLIESFLDGYLGYLCVLDQSGTILRISEPFARLMGEKGREALTGLKATDAVTGCADLKDFFASIVGHTDVSRRFATVSVHRNGQRAIWIKFEISKATFPSAGQCLTVSGIDVTDEMSKAQNAHMRCSQWGNFLMKMGHELRTPINTVLGYAKLLSDVEGLPHIARGYVSTILTHEANLSHVLGNALEYAKHESGQSAVIAQEVDVKRLIEEITQSYIDQFGQKLVSLTVDFNGSFPDTVITDPVKITHVISNLLSNALTYTKKGSVSVTVSYKDGFVIDVEDTGIGIPPADREQVFELFSGDGSEISLGGIGLYIARTFARMLSGDLELVRSDTTSGSLFRFTFTAEEVKATKRRSLQITDYTTIQGLSRPCKILLVDDVDINLAMLEIFLAPAGFDVSIASNGNEALRIFNQFSPDIVFMDLIMPEKDGFEATKDIKALRPDVPVIALTASIVDSVKERALEAGVNDFMYKPFIPERFFEIIAEHTGISYVVT